MKVSRSRITTASQVRLRLAITGGQSIPPELVDRFEARTGATMSILYGMTELSGTVTAVAPGDDTAVRQKACGHPLPGVEIRIVAPATNASVPDGRIGEVQVRGWLTMTGCLGDEMATAATILPSGWLHRRLGHARSATGCESPVRSRNDHPVRREHLPRLDRESASPTPCIADAAVVGIPDETYGETVAAAWSSMMRVIRPVRMV